MDLENKYRGTLDVWRKDHEKFKFAARVVAEAMSAMEIKVTASTDIGGKFTTGIDPFFVHEYCENSVTGKKTT